MYCLLTTNKQQRRAINNQLLKRPRSRICSLSSRSLGLLLLHLFLLLPLSALSAEKICRVCHNEDLLSVPGPCPTWQKHAHPVYVVPSLKVTIPDMYPLNEKGEIYCGTCHMRYIEPGSEKRKKGPVGQVFLRGENSNSSMCKRCHAPKLAAQLQGGSVTKKYDKILDDNYQPDVTEKFDIGSQAVFNHPVDVISPRMPRQIEENGGKPGMLKDQVICQSCHKMHQTTSRDLLIVDNSRSELCGFCHSPMFGLSRKQTTEKGTHPVNVVPSTSILAKVVAMEGGKLGKRRQIICLTCHSIHKAKVKKGLLVRENDRSALCFQCHSNIQQTLSGTRHDLSVSAPEDLNVLGQTSEKGGLCSPCHLVHHGRGAKMWARPIDKKINKKDIIAQLCISCHASEKNAEKKRVGRFTHPTGVNISGCDNPYVRLPLFSEDGAPLGRGNVTCATCHNVHRWSPGYGQDSDKLQEGNSTNSFLRVTNLASRLCYECHLIQKTIQGTSHDLTLPFYSSFMAPQLLKEISGTGESQETMGGKERGLCQHCHVVHNAVSVKLWARQVGPGEDPISKICNSCHSDGMVAEKNQTGRYSHPVNIDIQKLGEGFQTDLPLFTDNLMRDEAGKILCNTCHNIHQWDPKVPLKGTGKIEIGTAENSYLRKTANDSEDPLCESCHANVGLVRGTEHDLRVSAPQEKNPRGNTADQSGVCGACHAVHNATHSHFLWSKIPGPGTDFISRACNSCHWEDRCASSKTVGQHSHPVNVSTFSTLESVDSIPLPVFNSSLRRVSEKTVSSLSPIHIDSLKARQNVVTEENVEKDKWLSFLKRRFIETRRKKNKTKGKIEQLLKVKQELKARMDTEKFRMKELSGQVAEKDSDYQDVYDEASDKERKLKFLKSQERTIKRKIKRLETISSIGSPALNRGGPPTKGSSKGPPKGISSGAGGGPPPPGGGYDSDNADDARKRAAGKKKREDILEKRREDLRNLKQEKEKKTAEIAATEKEVSKFTSQYKVLEKELKEYNVRKKEIKKSYVLLLKQFKVKGVEQHQHKKSFEKLQEKLAKLQEEIEEIAPQSFIHKEDVSKNILAQASLMEELDMDFRREFLGLKNEYGLAVDTYDQILNKYSELRFKYKDILLYPNKKRKISLMEMEKLVIEGLAEDLEQDVDIEPQGKMLCNTCHNVHQWNPDKKETGPGKMVEGDFSNSFLKLTNDNGYRLCVVCHKDKAFVEGTEHDLMVSASQEKNVLNQAPDKAGLCGNCHLVHNAAFETNLWAKEIDKGVVKKLFKVRNLRKKYKKNGKSKQLEFRETKTDYYAKLKRYKRRRVADGKIKKRKAKILKRIAEAEASIKNQPFKQHVFQKKILTYKKQLKFLGGIIGTSDKKNKDYKNVVKKVYLKLKRIKTFLDKTIKRIKKLDKVIADLEEEFRRTPWDYSSMLCRSCHQEGKCAEAKQLKGFNHSVEVEVVLPETIPEVFDGPGKKENKIIEEKQKQEKEENEEEKEDDKQKLIRKLYAYPFFTKDGELGYEEGKVFCPTCHNVHQWDPTNHAKGDGRLVEGDARNSFLRLENSPDSQLCSGCHPKQARVVGSDHDLFISAPLGKNPRGQTVAESGVCGTCHAIHSVKDKNNLWVGQIGPKTLEFWNNDWARDKDRSIGLCTGCHNPAGVAASKVPKAGLHPAGKGYLQLEVKDILPSPEYPYLDYVYKGLKRKLGILNIRSGATPKIALFDQQGHLSPEGNITCLTCHDPHTWSVKGETPKKIAEGTVADSFLKKDIVSRFCSDCHKVDSIYDYAFFHASRDHHEKPKPKTKQSPHWKTAMEDQACTLKECHQNQIHNALHPIGVEIDVSKGGFNISKKLPLVDGKIECITCHNPEIPTAEFAVLKKKNPSFIRGIYEDILHKKYDEKKTAVVVDFVAGPPKIQGLMAGPGGLGRIGGQGGSGGRNQSSWANKLRKRLREKEKKREQKESSEKRRSYSSRELELLQVNWSRYQICYLCHIETDYKQFSPHKKQLNKKGGLNEEVCLVCHTRVPDRRNVSESNFYLVRPIGDMCINCHAGFEKQHPMEKDHFGKKLSKSLLIKTRALEGALAAFIPLDSGKLVCSSCHNPHAPNVIQVVFADKGSGNRSKLRLSGEQRCSLCHMAADREPDKDSQSSPF